MTGHQRIMMMKRLRFFKLLSLERLDKDDDAAGLAAQNDVENFINSKLSSEAMRGYMQLSQAPEAESASKRRESTVCQETLQALGRPYATTISVKFEIETSRGPVDAFTLATQCVDGAKFFIISKCRPSTIACALGSTPSLET